MTDDVNHSLVNIREFHLFLKLKESSDGEAAVLFCFPDGFI